MLDEGSEAEQKPERDSAADEGDSSSLVGFKRMCARVWHVNRSTDRVSLRDLGFLNLAFAKKRAVCLADPVVSRIHRRARPPLGHGLPSVASLIDRTTLKQQTRKKAFWVLWLLFVWHFGGCLFYYLAGFCLPSL
jgi:hypothetical protein